MTLVRVSCVQPAINLVRLYLHNEIPQINVLRTKLYITVAYRGKAFFAVFLGA